MSFLHPEFLYYMLPPLIILFGLLLTQKETEAHFFSTEVIDRLRVSTNSMTKRARNALFFLVGFFMIIALAEPVIDDGKILVKAKSADLMIAIDISDSMLAQDLYPNRLELAKQKALMFLDEMSDERVGVMAFAKSSYLVSPLSFDSSAVSFLLKQLDTNSITEQGTNFLSILETFAKTSENRDEKYLLILSDGGDDSDFSKEIEFAQKNKIVVFVLGIATKEGAPVKKENGAFITHNGKIIISKLNEEIASLATKSGGVYIESSLSNKDVKAMLKEVKSISNVKELKSEEIHNYKPLFYYPLGLAILLLLMATSSLRVKTKLSALVLFSLLGLSSAPMKASMLDFVELGTAKKAYEAGEYEKSANIYEEYANKSQMGEAYFNTGNAYYKQKDYKKAIEAYKNALFDKDEMRAKNFSNLGNAYAKSGELQKAVEAYENSLEIQEDKETKENLERVKKLLKEQESKEDEKKDKQDKNDSSESGDEDSDEKDEKNQDESSSKSSQSDEEKKSDETKAKQEEDEQKKDKQDAKDKQEKKEQLDELKENQKKSDEDSDADSAEMQKQEMSEAEQRKWLDELNTQNSSFMYKLSDEEPTKEMNNEKPW
ncbi:MAG: VWA domain-containing protein [Sulfurimonas sp.]|uniref:VWA domain-containing protein n=1 Tax=Sulfurimonas sp. TaxID=2022749 RepID=UPI0025FC28D3|nr:VWA domain-containing protein [Sulfurimonas sp.]MCK9491433.1 VWA domain-containing protein [Sulfurimonas sp.]